MWADDGDGDCAMLLLLPLADRIVVVVRVVVLVDVVVVVEVLLLWAVRMIQACCKNRIQWRRRK